MCHAHTSTRVLWGFMPHPLPFWLWSPQGWGPRQPLFGILSGSTGFGTAWQHYIRCGPPFKGVGLGRQDWVDQNGPSGQGRALREVNLRRKGSPGGRRMVSKGVRMGCIRGSNYSSFTGFKDSQRRQEAVGLGAH